MHKSKHLLDDVWCIRITCAASPSWRIDIGQLMATQGYVQVAAGIGSWKPCACSGAARSIWLVLNLLLLFAGSGLTMIPLLGPMLFALLTPIFMAGMMCACRDAELGAEVKVAHLFRGFRHNTTQLITVGGIYLVGQVVISGLLFSLGGEELQSILKAAMENTPVPTTQTSGRLSLALLITGALFVPLAMALWFAPALIMLEDRPAFAAMKLSVRGCLHALLPMLVYGACLVAILVGLLFILRFILAILPAQIGFLRGMGAMVVLVLWVTVTVISVYTSYRDIFVAPARA